MDLAEMEAHRAQLAALLDYNERTLAAARAVFGRRDPDFDADTAALRWALTLVDARIADERVDQADERDPAFQAAMRAALRDPATRTLAPGED